MKITQMKVNGSISMIEEKPEDEENGPWRLKKKNNFSPKKSFVEDQGSPLRDLMKRKYSSSDALSDEDPTMITHITSRIHERSAPGSNRKPIRRPN